ncbi:hypothetical protein SAMN05444280_1183 [Tangfeifania diversioriginum]|uniref:Uncharacterized protein n=1 Tax=Tangfeifania diversioriginum TaxID=1168035 RepID=A0A1M6IV90_9BACT|nr:hypothetical protein SAMN05444280_1183 [Tangfeifania diversioriginum]
MNLQQKINPHSNAILTQELKKKQPSQPKKYMKQVEDSINRMRKGQNKRENR